MTTALRKYGGSLALLAALVAGAAACADDADAPDVDDATADDHPYRIGVSGAVTGPFSGSYLPHVEGIRLYVERLNDQGGIGGHPVELVVTDDEGEPAAASSNARRLMDDEEVLAVALMSVSATYEPMFDRAEATETPLALMGQAVCAPQALGPDPHPYVFCAGSTAPPEVGAHWQVPLVQALAEREDEDLQLGLVSVDVPISRLGVDTMEDVAEEMGIDVVDNLAVPPGTADLSGAASRLVDGGANYVTSWAPMGLAVQMQGALRAQGWEGTFVHNHSAEAEDTLLGLDDPQFLVSPEYAFTVDQLDVFDEIAEAADSYGASESVDMLTQGWAAGMILEAVLEECGWPCEREDLREAFYRTEADTGGIYHNPTNWTESDHSFQPGFTAYGLDEDGEVRRLTEFTTVEPGEIISVELLEED